MKAFLLASLILTVAASPIRSPKHAASISGKPLARKAIVAQPAPVKRLAPRAMFVLPTPPAPAPRLPSSFHITVQWDAAPGIAGYNLWMGANGNVGPPARFTTNNWLTVSNLWPGVRYEFCVTQVGTNGLNSLQASPGLFWPVPQTNYLALGISSPSSTAWSTNWIVTNPTSPSFYRIKRDPDSYAFQQSPDLKSWKAIHTVPTLNLIQPPYVLRWSKWSNLEMQKPD